MHIALVYSDFEVSGSFGGVTRYLMDLSEGLLARGHRVTVLTSATKAGTERRGALTVIKVRAAPQTHNRVLTLIFPLIRSLGYWLALRRLTRHDKVDIVEFSNWDKAGFFPALIKVAPHATRVVTMGWQSRESHRAEERALALRLGDAIRDWTEFLPVRRSDVVLAPSTAHARVIRERVGLSELPITVPLGVAPADDQPQPSRAELPTLLYVGRLEARKGFDLLLQAFEPLAESMPDLRLIVVGDDTPTAPDQGFFGQFWWGKLNLNARARVQLAGWLDDSALEELYRKAWAVVIPSRYESFGLPAVEAMRCGLPVIAARVGGLQEVVADGAGVLVDPENVAELSAAMRRIATDGTLRQRLAENGRQRYASLYTVEAFVRRTEEAYQTTLEGIER